MKNYLLTTAEMRQAGRQQQQQAGISRPMGNQHDRTSAYGGGQSGPGGQAHQHTTNVNGSQTAGGGHSGSPLLTHMTNENDRYQQQAMAAVNGSQAYNQGLSGQVNLAGAYRRQALDRYAGSPGGAQLIARAQALSAQSGGVSPAGIAAEQSAITRSPLVNLNASQQYAQDVATNQNALAQGFASGQNLYQRPTGEQVRMAPGGFAVVQRADGTQALTSANRMPMSQTLLGQIESERQQRLQDPARQQRALEVFARRGGKPSAAAQTALESMGIEPQNYLDPKGRVDKAKVAAIIKRPQNHLSVAGTTTAAPGKPLASGQFSIADERKAVDYLNTAANPQSPAEEAAADRLRGLGLDPVAMTQQDVFSLMPQNKSIWNALTINPETRAQNLRGQKVRDALLEMEPAEFTEYGRALATTIRSQIASGEDSTFNKSPLNYWNESANEIGRGLFEHIAEMDLGNDGEVDAWLKALLYGDRELMKPEPKDYLNPPASEQPLTVGGLPLLTN